MPVEPVPDACNAPTSGGSQISVIIPTFMEEACIQEAVRSALQVADDVVVVDGGSGDRTCAAAAHAGARVVLSKAGRGTQLDVGARAAKGNVLLFLHADARLPVGAGEAIEQALRDPAVIAGNFRLLFTPRSAAATVFSAANHWRRLWLKIYYGDSAIFVRREIYEQLGGIRPLPLFEDYDFVRRLERFGRTSYLSDHVVTASARRFANRPWRTLALWTFLQVLYSLGVNPERLSRFYVALR